MRRPTDSIVASPERLADFINSFGYFRLWGRLGRDGENTPNSGHPTADVRFRPADVRFAPRIGRSISKR
jgi:hypothetical protein